LSLKDDSVMKESDASLFEVKKGEGAKDEIIICTFKAEFQGNAHLKECFNCKPCFSNRGLLKNNTEVRQLRSFCNNEIKIGMHHLK